MKIRQIHIENFRCIEKLEIYKPDTVNLIIGRNNSGKTAFLEALDLALDPYKPWWRRDVISEYDFFNREFVKREIRVEVVFDSFQEHETVEFEEYFEAEKEGTYISSLKNLNPETAVVRILLRCKYDSKDKEFKSETIFLKPEAEGKEVSRPLKEKIGFKYFGSRRDPLKELAFYQHSVFSRLFEKHKLRDEINQVIKHLEETEVLILQNPGFRKSLDELKKTLRGMRLVPVEGECLDFGVLNATERKVLQNLNLRVAGTKGGQMIPLEFQGSGIQNSIVVAGILRMIAEEEKFQNLILAIEEPEQNLEPYNQRLVLQALLEYCDYSKKENQEGTHYQLFATTHSPEIVRSFPVEGCSVIQQIDGEHRIMKLSECSPPAAKTFERYSPVLARSVFAKAVLLVEGASEMGGLPVFFDALMKSESQGEQLPFSGLHRLGVELIETGHVKEMPSYLRFLNAVNVPSICLIDNDRVLRKDEREKREEIEKEATVTILLPDDDFMYDYEGALAGSYDLCLLGQALNVVAEERNFEENREAIIGKLQSIDTDVHRQLCKNLKQTGSVSEIVEIVSKEDEEIARKYVCALMGRKKSRESESPISCKSTREARLVAEYLVQSHVPNAFKELASHIESFMAQLEIGIFEGHQKIVLTTS